MCLAFADQITLSSTSSLTMVFNSILATQLLGEVFSRYDLLSIMLISSGSTICILVSNFTPVSMTIDVRDSLSYFCKGHCEKVSLNLEFDICGFLFDFSRNDSQIGRQVGGSLCFIIVNYLFRVITQIQELYEDAQRRG